MQAELILLYIIVFLFGIVIGSFLNVLIYRLPLHENITTERSHCMACGRQLKWYDLVPLFSYICLLGRCRYCKTKLSVQYPLIEFLNGAGYVVIFVARGISSASVLYALCFSCLIVISIIDWRTYEIPVGMNICILVLGIVNAILDPGNLPEYLIGFVSVSGFLLLIYFLTKGRGIGGGDIKLMAVAGLLLGWKLILLSLCLGCIIGSVIHLLLMKFCSKDKVLAFGPYLSAGIVISMLAGNQMISWYLDSFLQ